MHRVAAPVAAKVAVALSAVSVPCRCFRVYCRWPVVFGAGVVPQVQRSWKGLHQHCPVGGWRLHHVVRATNVALQACGT